MTDTLKSVLFVDYDSLYLALRGRDPSLARRFAAQPAALLESIEAGELIGAGGPGPVRRRILMRRCYADPRTIGKARDSFVTQGFQVVDCPILPGHERNSAEVQITLDTIDALAHPTAFDEFILLAADSDFTPLIYRLRAHNRAATILSSATTAGSYRAIADSLDEGALVALLSALADGEEVEEDETEEAAARPVQTRDDLATLARRIHNAAQVPLFAPKTYAELFRALADEIAEQGYHFQRTAENVAGRLVASGRKASRRQVAFVVKGLALKGHILSDRDTPERLADVFREQVLYLARHAGIEVDPRVERQVGLWIAGAAFEPAEALVAIGAEPPLKEPAPSAGPEAHEASDTDQVAPESVGPPEIEPGPPAEASVAAGIEPETPAAPDDEPAAIEDLAALADQPDPAGPDDAAPAPEVAIEPVPVRAAPAVRPPIPRGPAAKNGPRPPEAPLDPFESSLLAAIAEAVQAVDPARPGKAPPVIPVEAEPRIEPSPDIAPVKPEPAVHLPSQPEKSAAEAAAEADIGDEIQRILAAYSQNRKPGAG